jgi:signal transduction histidine kinase
VTLEAVGEHHADGLAAALLREAAARTDLGPLLRELPRQQLEEEAARLGLLLRRAFAGDLSGAEVAVRALAEACARRGVEISALHYLARALEAQAIPHIVEACGAAPSELVEALACLHGLVFRALETGAREFVRAGAEIAREHASQNRRVQEANRFTSEFVADMSHDLRAPLNAIIGFAELLQDEEAGPLQQQQKEFTAEILGSGRDLLRLLDALVDMARVEAGKLVFRPEPVDLEAALCEVTGVVGGSAAAKRIRVNTEVDAAVRQGLDLDPACLRQILYGYVFNAIKLTPEGGTVTVRALPEGADELRIEVEGTEVGSAAEDLDRLVFELPQAGAGATQQHSGAGLCLLLTRRLVEAQGGRVEARTTWAQGGVFAAIMPRTGKGKAPPPPLRTT